MQQYYSQAYGTIAATSAGDSTGCPMYLYEIDDFNGVVQGKETRLLYF
jgi:hypothetical protein